VEFHIYFSKTQGLRQHNYLREVSW